MIDPFCQFFAQIFFPTFLKQKVDFHFGEKIKKNYGGGLPPSIN
jgi:hypothetical protein|tara:strand:+ start:1881 stop:2012 length:132 start_codon:yes stop_codon:yes gene_type:complete